MRTQQFGTRRDRRRGYKGRKLGFRGERSAGDLGKRMTGAIYKRHSHALQKSYGSLVQYFGRRKEEAMNPTQCNMCRQLLKICEIGPHNACCTAQQLARWAAHLAVRLGGLRAGCGRAGAHTLSSTDPGEPGHGSLHGELNREAGAPDPRSIARPRSTHAVPRERHPPRLPLFSCATTLPQQGAPSEYDPSRGAAANHDSPRIATASTG
jgi:hypothetical protein